MNGKIACGVLLAAVALSACSSSRTLERMGLASNSPTPPPQNINVQTGNPLALPPDLALRRPGETSSGYQPNTVASASLDQNSDYAAAPAAPAVPAAPVKRAPVDVYAEYGVSKVNPDGTQKTQAVLDKELKAAILARKRQQNPNYGTIFNMGSIFRDG